MSTSVRGVTRRVVKFGARLAVLGCASPEALFAILPERSTPNTRVVTTRNTRIATGRLESRAADFLPHAFLLYPDRDYCVLTLPSVGAESVLLRHFSPVPARPGSAFNHVLYVMHRFVLERGGQGGGGKKQRLRFEFIVAQDVE